MACFPLNYQTLVEIDTTPDGASRTWARLAAGISGFDPSNNDELDQTGYLDGDGYKSTDVIGAQLVLALSGHRIYDDPAQDYIFGKQFSLGCDRKTNLRITNPDGSQKQGEVTIANLDDGGGDAMAKQEIGFELHFNGKPTITAKSVAAALSVVVAGGTASGTTSFTATPGSEDTLSYKLGGASFGTMYAGQYIAGDIDYSSGDDILASVGQFLLMLEIDANGRVVGYAEEELEAGDIT